MPQIPGARLSMGSIVLGMVASGVGLNMAEARSGEEDEVPRAMRRRRTRSRWPASTARSGRAWVA